MKNLISKTEAAPKEHHDRGMSGRVVGEEGGASFLRLKSGHTGTDNVCVQSSSAEMGLGQTHWHIFIYTHIVIHMSTLLLCYTRHIMQKPVHKLQLLVFALTTLHITFSTKARHFRVRGRYVLDKVKRLDPYKKITISGF